MTTLLEKLQTEIDALTAESYHQHISATFYATSKITPTEIHEFIDTVANLPNLTTTTLPNFYFVYVNEISKFAMVSGTSWVDFNGTLIA